MKAEPLQFVFRRIDEAPSHWTPGTRWYVEAHQSPFCHPLGFAVVGSCLPA
jgi:hypothetical protein